MLVSRKEILSTVGKWKLSKNDVSCLSSVKIATAGNKIGFYSNQLKYQYDAEFELDSFQPDFINAVFFPDFLKALKSSKEKKTEILIETDRLIIDGIPVKFTDNTDKIPEEFRLGEKIEDIFLSKDELDEIRDMVFCHCSDDETRYFMTGICIEGTGTELNFVATNGRTLAKKEKKIESAEFSVIVPVQYLPKFAHDTIVSVYEKYTVFFSRNLDENSWEKFTVKNVDGTFPNYRRVIPENNNQNFEVMTTEFLEVLKKIKPFVDKTSKRIILTQNETAVIIKTGDVEFSVDCLKSNANFTCALNLEYLIMSINPDDSITKIRHCGESMKAITLQDDNLLRIIMPMQAE